MITDKEQLLEIIKTFGINNQKKKFAEESFEFIEAVTEYESDIRWEDPEAREVASDKAAIVEEMADCMVILRQFMLYLNIEEEELEKIIRFKTYRTLNRLKNGADKEIQP